MPTRTPRSPKKDEAAERPEPARKRTRAADAAAMAPPATKQRFSALCPSIAEKPMLQLEGAGQLGRRTRNLIVSGGSGPTLGAPAGSFVSLQDAKAKTVMMQRCESACSLGSLDNFPSALSGVPNSIDTRELPSPLEPVPRPCETPPCAPEAFESMGRAAKCLAPKKPRRPLKTFMAMESAAIQRTSLHF